MTSTIVTFYGPDTTVGEVREALGELRDDDPLTFVVADDDEERFGSFALIETIRESPDWRGRAYVEVGANGDPPDPEPMPPLTFEHVWDNAVADGECPLAEIQELLYRKMCGGRGCCENYEEARLPPIPF